MNFFSHNPLNRFSELRPDEAYMQQLWQQLEVRVLVVHESLSLIKKGDTGKRAAVLGQQEAEELAKQAQVQVYLGSEEGVPFFVLGFEEMQEQLLDSLGEDVLLVDLRMSAHELPQPDGALLAYARGMVHWNLRHRFCANCGSITYSTHAGHVRQCTNKACNLHHFPRTDTAIIVVISEGDACLLGRQAAWPKGMYATIAGFLEPGETLEQAVAREAQEETGVELEKITYHSSQPWPFPSSIMVGFSAEARSRKLILDNDELEAARWFTRSEVAAGLKDGYLRLPPPISIAYRLIRDWYNADSIIKLEELTGY